MKPDKLINIDDFLLSKIIEEIEQSNKVRILEELQKMLEHHYLNYQKKQVYQDKQ